jgi:hypothetical protein
LEFKNQLELEELESEELELDELDELSKELDELEEDSEELVELELNISNLLIFRKSEPPIINENSSTATSTLNSPDNSINNFILSDESDKLFKS